MIGRLLPHSENSNHKIAASAGLQDTLQVSTSYRTIGSFGIEITDHLHLIFTFTHHKINSSRLIRFDSEECGIGEYRTTSQAGSGHHHIITFVQLYSVFQEIRPRSTTTHIYIAFVIIEQLERAVLKLGDSEMRIVFRIG